VLGVIEDLPAMIKQHQVREVLIALDSADHQRLLEIVGLCAPYKVGIKIIPDLYDIISGQARTNQIYGFPLIEITPQLMPPWELATKRSIDIIVSAAILVGGLPLWLLIALLIKLDSKGPVLYKQERVGKDGRHFKIIKFRSMVLDAESGGAQWAGRRDPRVTHIGRILRRLHLDEIPQVFNVLRGEMSLVGPRPERPVFVENLKKEIPLYSRRLNVRPGVTGWAQVKHKYDETLEDVRKKIEYDLYYIENMSLRMDFKIILSTVSHMLMWKGH
jgi:exopolysaccharide biosynthesis polyprenyl glycosylphosphotransferase